MTEPTDAELWQLYMQQPGQHKDPIDFARAALAKWGTPPAVVGEPVAYLHDDGYWTAAKTDAGRNLNDRLLFAGSPKVAAYATPQPTQAQAGAVPLTDAQISNLWDGHTVPVFGKTGINPFVFARALEAAHGIKGGQHGTE